MSLRSFSFWFACAIAPVITVGAAEAENAAGLDFTLPASAASTILPVPEPGRAFLFFAGIIAMAFTYRSAWLNWKSHPQS